MISECCNKLGQELKRGAALTIAAAEPRPKALALDGTSVFNLLSWSALISNTFSIKYQH